MLTSASLYIDKIKHFYERNKYSDKFIYCANDFGNVYMLSNIEQTSIYYKNYVSVDQNDNILGLFKYEISPLTRSMYIAMMVSFEDKASYIFIYDILRRIHTEFTTCNMSRLEWRASSLNPVNKTYQNMIKHLGGICLTAHRNEMLVNGVIDDVHTYEILSENFMENIEWFEKTMERAKRFALVELEKRDSVKNKGITIPPALKNKKKKKTELDM